MVGGGRTQKCLLSAWIAYSGENGGSGWVNYTFQINFWWLTAVISKVGGGRTP